MESLKIREVIDQAIDGIDTQVIIAKKVQEAVEKALSEAISSSFGWNSDFFKGLKNKLNEQASCSLETIKLPEYGALLQNIFQKHVNDDLCAEAEKLQKSISDFIAGDFQTEYTLSEFVNALKKLHVEDCCSYSHGVDYKLAELTCIVGENDGNFRHFYLDFRPNKTKYECGIRFMSYKNESLSFHALHGIDAKNVFDLKGLSEVQLFLFKCNTRKVTLTELDQHKIKKEFDYSDYKINWREDEKAPSEIFEDAPDYWEED